MDTQLSYQDVCDRDLFVPCYSKITDNIYVGDYRSGVQAIADHKPITSIISLITVDEQCKLQYKHNGVQLYEYPFTDSPDEDIISHFETLQPIIKHALQQSGILLIHCLVGRSRSIGITILTLMSLYNHTFQSAYNLVNTKRGCFMNRGFIQQIKNYK